MKQQKVKSKVQAPQNCTQTQYLGPIPINDILQYSYIVDMMKNGEEKVPQKCLGPQTAVYVHMDQFMSVQFYSLV